MAIERVKAILFCLLIVVPTISSESAFGQSKLDSGARIKFARLAVSGTYNRVPQIPPEPVTLENLVHELAVTKGSVLSGNNTASRRPFVLISDLLSKEERAELLRISKETYFKTQQLMKELEDETFESDVAQTNAARILWKRVNEDDIPKIVRYQAVWRMFAIYGPEDFFRECFLSESVEISDDQIEEISKLRKQFLDGLSGELSEIEEFAYSKVLKKLSIAQQSKLFSKMERELLLSLCSSTTASRSSFAKNLTGIIPLEADSLAGASILKGPNTFYGMLPEVLLTTTKGFPDSQTPAELQEFTQEARGNLSVLYSLLGPWMLFAGNDPNEWNFPIGIQSASEELNTVYAEKYVELVGNLDQRQTQLLFAFEFKRRGLLSFLLEPSVRSWLEIDNAQAERLIKTSGEVREEYIELRQSVINGGVRKVLSPLGVVQRREMEILFGLPFDEIPTLFQSCSELELESIFSNLSPKFSTKRYRPRRYSR